ncbi:MAG: hypothetical protein K6G68_06185 [Oscillospiraceae bacterium]|nr:hypothetical protein [Oscillospiraceae bacterium]MCR5806605.1 hypothetical protein [Oscillospiraceae bacterium]
MELYGKNAVIRPFTAMQRSGRFVHSYIIIGEHGVGKRTSALYAACMLLCDNKCACGECVQCRRVLKNEHPDLRIVERSKKSYSVDDVREVVTDSFTSPNDCDRKIYLFTDCDGWSDAAQAALLKTTEDPPESVYYIFTGERLSSFLGTLISRSMVINIESASKDECTAALISMYPEKEEQELRDVSASFCGNIGRCREYLDGNEKLMENVQRIKKLNSAVSAGDEYACSAVLSQITADRTELSAFLGMFTACVRDSIVIKNGRNDLIGCDEQGSRKMSALPVGRLISIYDNIMDISRACDLNCNAAAAAAVLSGRLV